MAGVRVRRVLYWMAALAWAAVIFTISSVPGSSLPPGRYGVVGHLGGYTVLGLLLFVALRVDWRRSAAAAIAVLLASVYGATDELHQAFVPGRTPSVFDWFIDTVGALAGVSWALAVEYLLGRRRQ